jgi:hypothetical protein
MCLQLNSTDSFVNNGKNLDSSVVIVTRVGFTDIESEIPFSITDTSCALPSTAHTRSTRIIFIEINQYWCEVDNSPATNVKFQDTLNHHSIPSYIFMPYCLIKHSEFQQFHVYCVLFHRRRKN